MRPSRNDIRNDIHADDLSPANAVTTPCPVCGNPFTPIRRQRY